MLQIPGIKDVVFRPSRWRHVQLVQWLRRGYNMPKQQHGLHEPKARHTYILPT